MIDLLGRRPTLATVAAIAALIWAASFGIVRDFVWADLRVGLLRVDGFSRVTRAFVLLGFLLLLATLGMVISNDAIREVTPLLDLSPPDPRRGSTIPGAAVPATLFILTVAWSYLLTGSLHAHPLVRVLIPTLYIMNHADFGGKIWESRPLLMLASWVPLLALPAVVAARWTRPARPPQELMAILILVTWNQLIVQLHIAEAVRDGGANLFLSSFNNSLLNLTLLVMPFVLLTGLDIADFTRRMGGWVSAVGQQRLARWGLPVLLAGALSWQLRSALASLADIVGPGSIWQAMATLGFALVIPVWVLASWWWMHRRVAGHGGQGLSVESLHETASRWALWIIVVYFMVQLLTFTVLGVSLLLIALGLMNLASAPATVEAIGAATRNDAIVAGWRIGIGIVAMIGGSALAWRRHATPGLFLAVFGMVSLRYTLTQPGRPLEQLLPPQRMDPVDICWTLLVLCLSLLWLGRRPLTADRCARLLAVTVMLILVEQSEFIGNRFSPFFSFAGIGFVAFGIFWDAVTIGSWANADSAALPRVSRVFLYLGYVLLTVAVVNWAIGLHDLRAIERLTGEVALDGFRFIGKPFLYATFAILIGPLLATRPRTAEQR